MNAPIPYAEWKEQYAHRVKLMAGVKTIEATLEMLPDDEILKEQWQSGVSSNEAADDEMACWEE